MKIYVKAANSSSFTNQIPVEFRKYYRVLPDAEFENITGEDSMPYPCEDLDGYDCKHLAWLCAKDDYIDDLSNNALDIVELIDEAGDIFVGQRIGDMICPVDIEEVIRCCRKY